MPAKGDETTMGSGPGIPLDVYGIFSGPIDDAGAQRLINSLTTASANNVTSVHLVFQSAGGGIGEGICLHNLFQALPFEFTLYNTGAVSSIAVIAYLGAKRRKVSAYASDASARNAFQTASGEPNVAGCDVEHAATISGRPSVARTV